MSVLRKIFPRRRPFGVRLHGRHPSGPPLQGGLRFRTRDQAQEWIRDTEVRWLAEHGQLTHWEVVDLRDFD